MKTVIEIRQGVGGSDAKLLVEDLANLYLKVCRINNFIAETKQ